MHLHDHAGGALFGVQHALHFDHAHFDQVGRRALHGGVDGGALGARATRAVGAFDVGQVQAAAKYGFDIALFFGLLARALHIGLHAGVAFEIALDVVARGGVVNAQCLGQAKAAHAIDEAEVDDFGVAALFAADLFGRYAKDFGGGGTVNVGAGFKRPDKGGIFADVGHDAQLNLAVVGAGNVVAGRGNKCFANAAAFGRADGDILQVGVAA